MCAGGMLIAVVIGVLAGTWLAEYAADSRFGHAVRFVNDVLLSAPSILVGLFVVRLAGQAVPRLLGDRRRRRAGGARRSGGDPHDRGHPEAAVRTRCGKPASPWARRSGPPSARSSGARRASGHAHRRPARLRAHQRRNGAPAVHRAQQQLHQLGSDQADREPAGGHLQLRHGRRTRICTPTPGPPPPSSRPPCSASTSSGASSPPGSIAAHEPTPAPPSTRRFVARACRRLRSSSNAQDLDFFYGKTQAL